MAQQVLEYLGVPHDIDIRAPKPSGKPDVHLAEDDEQDHTDVMNALFAAANDLPDDDPLRALAAKQADAQPTKPEPLNQAKVSASPSVAPSAASTPQPAAPPHAQSTVAIPDEDKQLKVPSLVGFPVRKVIELAASAGLEVQITGSGTVRDQAPAAGTSVPPGTRIVVRCAR